MKLWSCIDLRGEDVFSGGQHANPNRRPKHHAAASLGEGLLLGISTSGDAILKGYRRDGNHHKLPSMTLSRSPAFPFLIHKSEFSYEGTLSRRLPARSFSCCVQGKARDTQDLRPEVVDSWLKGRITPEGSGGPSEAAEACRSRFGKTGVACMALLLKGEKRLVRGSESADIR